MEAETQMSDAVSVEDRLLGGLIDGLASHPGRVVPLLGILAPEHFGSESTEPVPTGASLVPTGNSPQTVPQSGGGSIWPFGVVVPALCPPVREEFGGGTPVTGQR